MKKYCELKIELVLLQPQDVVRTSLGFEGGIDGFDNPNSSPAENAVGNF